MTAAPTGVRIRTYRVGFGDCFLLTFEYAADRDRHVLIDFGTMRTPAGSPDDLMLRVATNVAEVTGATVSDGVVTGGGLTAVVATHRHKDHISGFKPNRNKKGSGDIIAGLKPELVVQPWTEDPRLAVDATGPLPQVPGFAGQRQSMAVAGLKQMQAVANAAWKESRRSRHFSKSLKDRLNFLGEDNVSNLDAVKNLMTMAENEYVHFGSPTRLDALLPGVRVTVLGPPTVDQSDSVRKQTVVNRDQFWHLQARAFGLAGPLKLPKARPPFPNHVLAKAGEFPAEARWLVRHAREVRGEQLLQMVTMLDKAMNNTSLILLFEFGDKALLFPGDAQWENWAYALSQPAIRTRLSKIDLYKVGHHGSLNATPKGLWDLLGKRSTTATPGRLKTLLSTLGHVHGDETRRTEVPRKSLLRELKTRTDLLDTQEYDEGEFWRDVRI